MESFIFVSSFHFGFEENKNSLLVLNLEVDLFDTAGRSVVVAKISGFVAGS
jgi:hypothetical protein